MPDSRTPERPPMLPICELWEKKNAKGEVYLIGRVGNVRVVVTRSPEAPNHHTPSTLVHFGDARRARQGAVMILEAELTDVDIANVPGIKDVGRFREA
jgi:hypothetical protein